MVTASATRPVQHARVPEQALIIARHKLPPETLAHDAGHKMPPESFPTLEFPNLSLQRTLLDRPSESHQDCNNYADGVTDA